MVHCTGLLGVGTALMCLTLTPVQGATLYGLMSSTDSLVADLQFGIAVHLALTAAVWGLVYAIGQLVLHRKRSGKVRTLKLSAGTVMIETVIVLPVFLLLVFGLMQLSINNIASVMTSYAGFSGARAVWVWDGEQQAGRRGVDEAAMLERARIQVAMAMAPVASGEFFNDDSALSDEAKLARKGMAGRFSFLGGDVAVMMASTNLSSNRQAYRSNKSFWRAIDSESFGQRAVRKFSRAYLATDVGTSTTSAGDEPGILQTNGEIGLRFTYQHHQTMPVVSPLFGEFGNSGGRGGYFNELSKEHTFPRQRHTPSANWPEN